MFNKRRGEGPQFILQLNRNTLSIGKHKVKNRKKKKTIIVIPFQRVKKEIINVLY